MSYGNSTLNFLKKCQTVFQSYCILLHFHQQWHGAPPCPLLEPLRRLRQTRSPFAPNPHFPHFYYLAFLSYVKPRFRFLKLV